jgi:cyanate permease
MALPKFLQPIGEKLGGFLHPQAAVSADTSSAVAGATSSALSTSAAPASTSGGSSLGVWAGLAAVVAALWYFISKRGDKRHKHKY